MNDSAIDWPMLVALLAALAGCGYFFWEWRKALAAKAAGDQDVAVARARLEQIETIKAERDAALRQASDVAAELSAEKSASAARAAQFEERERALTALRAELEKSFHAAATQAMDASQQRFFQFANETFLKHKETAQSGVKEILTPVQESLARFAVSVNKITEESLKDRSTLAEQMRQIVEMVGTTNTTTSKLVNALRAAPKTRGRWGEETLKNVLELSGLSPHADFLEQTTHKDGEGNQLRPDVIIRLPGGRSIIVDAKVALSGYLDAMEATDEAAREQHLKKHAQELRQHVKALAAKDYSKHVDESADFVALFIPGENFFAAAVERDPSLFEDAMRARVVIVTPVTLMALARSIAYGWRQEESAKNAMQIADLGRELYRRMGVMAEHMTDVGKAIGKSVQTYNALVTSVESRVLPQARRFKDLGSADAGVELPELTHIETAPRLPAPQEDALPAAPASGKRKGAA
ncbi:MAG: DNA recombination protein RmuC [Hyphomonadaceae bacterium]|nr:DNA recombination protein RmuC [Hyphomonadaceae bacterium]